MITSRHHPQIKEIRALSQKKYRYESRRAFVEGPHLVQEAVACGWPLYALVCTPQGRDLLPQGQAGVPILEVTPEVMASLAQTDSPPAVGAVIGMKQYSLDQVLQGGTIVLLDGLQDPGNVGTIIRAAAALGAGAVILGEGSVDLYNPKTIRATMGTMFHLPVLEGADLCQVVARLRENGAAVLGAEPRGGTAPWQIRIGNRTVAVVIGHETRGVSETLQSFLTERITIPMAPGIESLNAAMAGVILLYEVWRDQNIPGEK